MKRGFTLVELLAVVIILAIISLITTPMVLNIIETAKLNAALVSAAGYIEAVEKQTMQNIIMGGNTLPANKKVNINTLSYVKVSGNAPTAGRIYSDTKGLIKKAELCVEGKSIYYNGIEYSISEKDYCNPIVLDVTQKIEIDSIYDIVSDSDMVEAITSGETYTLELSNGEIILAEIYVYEENVNYTETPILCDDTVDTKMCILIYEDDLTIDQNVIITPQTRKKGFTIYVNGTLTNNGDISMTARGAKAAGQEVILYKNIDESMESVPANGASGADRVTRGADGCTSGGDGVNAEDTLILRATGGGGSGAACRWNSKYTLSGAGGSGTSYSGGAGGGGSDSRDMNNLTAGAGSANGGAGGAGKSSTNNGSTYSAGGGAGNPGGSGMLNNDTNSAYAGTNGTGGLLIIYANNLINNNLITSNGSLGGQGVAAGGSSGGGSINIFYTEGYANNGIITSDGVKKGNGGTGGNGSVTIGSIATGSFIINS